MGNPLRQTYRASCTEKCILVYNGLMQECILKNISISGAQIILKSIEIGIFSGCMCVLHLCADTQKCPAEYACQVIHISSMEIGLKFLDRCLVEI
jgi:hypothetical protein